jgi:hypothetical protein
VHKTQQQMPHIAPESMIQHDMLSLLKRQPSEDHYQYKLFPMALLLNTKLVEDAKASDTQRWRVKYTFEMVSSLFDRFVAPFFQEPSENEFTEVFCDDSEYSLILESSWYKFVHVDENWTTISMKHVPLQASTEKYIAYREAKIHAKASNELSLFDVISVFLRDLPEKINLYVRRKTYKHKKSKYVTLYRDSVRFESGDFYTVCSIFADVPVSQVNNLISIDETLDTSTNQEVMEAITKHASPARSKIIEYFSRHKQKIYDSLIEKGHVLPLGTDSHDEPDWDSEVEYAHSIDVSMLDLEEQIDRCLEKHGVGIQPHNADYSVLSDDWDDNED